ncbi:FAD-dependent oxidoreductase [Salisediminibacterium halotolerans]|uniref:FAD-dependent oxidoreductase n=1 Tax=Salisediminibacterium halotolerans TaxID=517425 RepID=UPI000EADFF89|nr:FAD-dependent oxidoreductase [Salisediminibacterium halotolerans]RLJ72246.1 NADPH-dependent 2,4-dienoyl-CoA reductase/sulfur reductase-like enzyme [Actinophytocola xinjiangensis]RPE85460.1 NADPH-dependent 2,4-dienoyl-CoA reductase/sulfur reductase-like enzyme [Salisediminibacterium halotolerans]TWG33416.1 NADPH-dependent 2,4-dienoyl-CoA reductase/sulfur reductase-like enzyme [Salisediminibacterium halotolerans]GEL07861.1 pyridine nucleotide-disulfide oxidoreductase [Salisediminibacterium hal
MSNRVLVVGGVAGGASVAARARRLDESAEITMFEKGPHVSFSNCALPFHLSGIVENSEDLVLMNPDKFAKQYNIDARTNSEVMKINREEKTVTVKNHANGEEYTEAYDKLFLSPGAKPIMPPVEGIDSPHVFTVRNVADIRKLQNYLQNEDVKDIAVVGAGYIGIEVVENLKHAGKDVSLIEAQNQVMAPFDVDMAQLLHKELHDQGVNLILNDAIVKIDEDTVELKAGKKVPAKAVVMAVGVAPETGLAKQAGLELGETGAIKVDHNYQTNDENIYAVGDAIEVYHRQTRQRMKLPLAGPAQRQARAAAGHMYNLPHQNTGVIGSSVIQVFDLNAASTGVNEKCAKDTGIQYDFVYIIPADKVGLMPESNPLHFKLLYEVPTGKILGAQAIGKGNVDKRIDIIAAMITKDATLEDLKELELCYSVLYGTAKDVVNFAALVGLNLLNGVYKQVTVPEVRELVENDAFIIDAREKDEYENGHLINAVNIPLSEFRERLDEIPTDQPVYVHCRSGQRSYNFCMALQNKGYHNVYNMSGSYLGICQHEYYNDQITGREKIVTEYNFN